MAQQEKPPATQISAIRIATPKREKPKSPGPGDKLTELLDSLGIDGSWCASCSGRRDTMNQWGVKGCRERVDEIAGWLRKAADKAGTKAKLRAAWNAVLTGTWIDPMDPYRGLVLKAIDAAEQTRVGVGDMPAP